MLRTRGELRFIGLGLGDFERSFEAKPKPSPSPSSLSPSSSNERGGRVVSVVVTLVIISSSSCMIDGCRSQFSMTSQSPRLSAVLKRSITRQRQLSRFVRVSMLITVERMPKLRAQVSISLMGFSGMMRGPAESELSTPVGSKSAMAVLGEEKR